MSTARIDELRSKFEENPRRYFAPLANEYRKAGDLDTAIRLCREHLSKQPGHMSGHIVYGQALFESGQLDESRQVFEAALALDPENLIALRHLGEIARAKGDAVLARRWYERVLDADPRNDEIAQQLATLFTPVVATPVLRTPVDFEALEYIDPREQSRGANHSDEEPGQSTGSGEFEAEPVDTHSDIVGAQTIDEAISDAFAESAEEAALIDFDVTTEYPQADFVVTGNDEQPRASGSHLALDDGELIDVSDLLDAFAVHDVRTELDPDEAGPPSAPADVVSPVSLDEHDYSAQFEEGLIAPEWPDTSELVSRVEAPPRATPTTPAFSVEAVAAFGRENVDPEPLAAEEDIEPGEREFDTPLMMQVVETSSASEMESSELDDMHFAEEVMHVPEPAAEADEHAPVDASSAAEANDASELIDAPVAETDSATTTEEKETEDDSDIDIAAEGISQPDASSTTGEMPVITESDYADDGEVDVTTTAERLVERSLLATIEMSIGDEQSIDDEQPVDNNQFIDNEHSIENKQSITDEQSSDADDTVIAAREDLPAEVQEVAQAIARDARQSGETEAIRVDVHDNASDNAPTFVTETMAELLVSQGFTERAESVYRELVRRHPFDPVLVARLEELRQMNAAAQHVATAAKVPSAIASTSEPTATGNKEPESRAQYSTPLIAPRAIPEDSETERRPTARDHFHRLASRRVPRRTPPRAAVAIESPDDGLAGLFGAAEDEGASDFAARAFADAFAPMPDAPFGASTATPAFVARTITAPSSPTVDTGSHAAIEATSDEVSQSDARPQSGFSFDRFFPDPATVQGVASTATPAKPAPASNNPPPATNDSQGSASPAGDDLADFAAWLKNLDKP